MASIVPWIWYYTNILNIVNSITYHHLTLGNYFKKSIAYYTFFKFSPSESGIVHLNSSSNAINKSIRSKLSIPKSFSKVELGSIAFWYKLKKKKWNELRKITEYICCYQIHVKFKYWILFRYLKSSSIDIVWKSSLAE